MKAPRIDEFIKDGDVIKLGETEIIVIHTPGHTQGGACFYINGNLFSSDTIFKESVGRCDLPGGDFDQIVESIESKIFTLPQALAISASVRSSIVTILKLCILQILQYGAISASAAPAPR
jgi:glyoxylase-like metal-dependent hydrolase (beta-lactamase superfamily II)